MKNPIVTWTLKKVEYWRRQSTCIGVRVTHTFTTAEREQALAKLETLYQGEVKRTFAERILYLSELH